MRKYFWPFFTLVLASLALTGCSDSSGVFNAAPVANHTDLSITYLGQVFGTVGNVLTGTTGQMLGKLFYRLNQGIIVVAGIWLAYTVFTMVIRSAQEGSFMGQNKNVALAFLKIAIGFGLLIPNPTTGYSVLQDVVMKVVVEGVSLADTTWDYGLTYLQNGGSVWHRPETNDNGSALSSTTLNTLIGTQSKPGAVTSILASEVCMATSNNAVDPQQQANPDANSNMPNIALPGGSSHGYYDVVDDSANQQFEFAGSNTGTDPSNNSNCGVLSYAGKAPSGKSAILEDALYQLIINLKPAAQKLYCEQNSSAAACLGDSSSSNPDQAIQQTTLAAIVNYTNNALPLTRVVTGNYQTFLTNLTSTDDQGWVLAGRYYWDLSQLESSMQTQGSVAYYATNPSGPLVQQDPANTALTKVTSYDFSALLANYNGAQTAGNTRAGPSTAMKHLISSTSGIESVVAAMIPGSGLVTDFSKLMAEFSNGPGGLMSPDPIITLHQIGVTSISIAGDIWFGLALAIYAVALVFAPANFVMNFVPAFQTFLQHLQPVMDITATAFWGSGVVLGFYLPMYPFILFTFGVIGWLIAVIEAMVAAPLICFGLTHPEGHDFLGEAKQALMLLLGIFLRPVLMVIGMIAGMILSYVSLRIVLYSFNGFIHDLFGSPTAGNVGGIISSNAELMMGHALNDSSGIMGVILMFIFVLPFVLAVFAALIYVITTQCFSLIYVLPDNILRWIGSPAQQSMAQQMMQQMGQGISTGASQAGQSLNTTAQSTHGGNITSGKGAAGYMSKKKEEDDKQKAASVDK